MAVTANALPEDIVLSAEAGCNLHLSQPISKHKLLSTIEEYGPRTASGDAPGVDAPGAEWPPLIGIEMPPGLEEAVPGYLAARQEGLPEMMALLATSGFERLAILAHDIKGTGGSYGFPVLTRMGAVTEQSAKHEPGQCCYRRSARFCLKNAQPRVFRAIETSAGRRPHGDGRS
jgi:hypothetical protein